MYASNEDAHDARYITTMRYSSASAEKMRRASAVLWIAYMILWFGAAVATYLSSALPPASKTAMFVILIAHAGYTWIAADMAEWLTIYVPPLFTRTVSTDEM
jgi:hypothetical protein